MSHGRVSRTEAIRALREYAEHIKTEATLILDTPEDEMDVRVVRGCFVQHLVEKLLP